MVVKTGSSLVTRADGTADAAFLSRLAGDIAALRQRGADVVLVSSGAVALGRAPLSLSGTLKLEEKQAAAAAGQSRLIEAWQQALSPHAIPAAQLLLTLSVTAERRSWLNARATLETLLALKAVPVINENDTVATAELRYGDNDRLAAHTAQMAGADLLILLSDVDGLYTANPAEFPNAQHIPYIATISPAHEAAAGSARPDGPGTGGMATKLAAAKIAAAAGCRTLITAGRLASGDAPLAALATGARATLIDAAVNPKSARKGWIASGLAPSGDIHIDAGAVRALRDGASLLAAGVTATTGKFARGDLVRILNAGCEIGRGLAGYDAAELVRIVGAKSADIEAILGYARRSAVIHRDDLVLEGH